MSGGPMRGRRLALAGVGVALVAVVAAVALSVSAGGGGTSVAPQERRAPAPDIAFTLADGERRSLSSFRGHPVVVAFVLPYCATCIDTLRTLDAVAEAYPDGSAVPIAVNVGSSGAGDLRDFAEDVGATKALYVGDPGLRGATAFGIDEVDTVVVIDSEGRVVVRGPGLSTKTILGAIAAT